MKTLLLLLFFSIYAMQAWSQSVTLYGQVKSASDTTGLPSAAVRLEKISGDSADAATVPGAAVKPDAAVIVVTDTEGRFRFDKLIAGSYRLSIEYLGFKPYVKTIQVKPGERDLGTILMVEDLVALSGVEVVGRLPLGRQMGDTTQFNAENFKTSANANAERLIEKMPGISVQDGQIQAQGEVVQEILVDGKPFFEGDVEAALKNLPAEIVQNIQIFDKKSDQAEFSGFDDGERAKTINIVIKPDRKKGQFGQASLGYGTDNRYLAGAGINFFNHEQRITVTGLSNDINARGYSIGDTPGSGLRGGSEGNTTTNRISLNYNDEWGETMDVSANYSYRNRKGLSEQFSFRDYFLPSDSGQVYSEEDRSNNTSAGQSLRMRLEYDPNDENELVIEPRFSIEQDDEYSYFLGNTNNDIGPINQSENNVSSIESELEFENEVHYRHRFARRGRTFSTSLETEFNMDKGETFRQADNMYYSRENPHERLDQHISPENRNFSWEANFSYTEPVGDSARMEIEYAVGNDLNSSDERAFNRIGETGDYTLLDTLLSNTFENEYFAQEIELGYQYSIQKLKVELEAEYQRASLENHQEFPATYDMQRTFHSLLPSVEVEYRFTKSKNLRLDYRTGTNAPSLEDLQDVIDNSNPLHLRAGNPNLRQSFQNRLSIRYRSFDAENDKVFYAGLNGSLTKNTISNSTIIADEAMELRDGIVLERGAQLTRPVNLDEGNWDIHTRFSYGQPVPFISSNLEVNGSIGYSIRPGMINDEVNISRSNNFGFGASVSSNISEKVDFNISTRSSYNMVDNTLRPRMNTNYFNQSTRFRGDFTFWKGLIFRTELNHRVNAGLTAGYDTNYLLWNISLSKLLFNNERGEICLAVNDLLKQNNNIERNVTELYFEDTRSNLLQQFFMLSFTYSIRHFAGS